MIYDNINICSYPDLLDQLRVYTINQGVSNYYGRYSQ